MEPFHLCGFGVFLVVLALALYERLKAGSPALVQMATAFGLIWAGLAIASGMIVNVGEVELSSISMERPGPSCVGLVGDWFCRRRVRRWQ